VWGSQTESEAGKFRHGARGVNSGRVRCRIRA
jgi:hypothetical protein